MVACTRLFRWNGCFVRALALLVVILLASSGSISPASAHERIGTTSHSIITANGDTVVDYLNIPPALWSRLKIEAGDDPESLRGYFEATMKVVTWDKTCDLVDVKRKAFPATGNTLFHLVYHCPQEVQDLTITSVAFLDLDESHVQFARLARPDNPRKFLREGVLSVRQKTFHIPDVRSEGSATLDRATAFLKLGIEHLLTGYDHILFLLTVIIGMTVRETIKAVTSFTLAHSLTMALAFLGFVSLSSNIVEPLIALTIVYVALENVFRVSVTRRWLLTFVFGLAHGLGFVGALKEITVSRNELLLSLVSFNLGIEFGQLFVIAIAMPLLYWLYKYSWSVSFRRAFSVGVVGLGGVWLAERIIAASQSSQIL
jgi:hydrogenase/urease accessory protein HupE